MRLLLFFVLLTGRLYLASAQSIVAAEYFIDQDPGIGNGFVLNLASEALTDFGIPTDNLTPGLHKFVLRVKQDNGTWSLYLQQNFWVQSQPSTFELAGAELFFDQDPGAGDGTALNPEADQLQLFSIDLDELSPGFHVAFLRVKQTDGTWGLFRRMNFWLNEPPVETEIVAAEYFWQNDPGVGKGQSIPITADTLIDLNQVAVPADTLEQGLHFLNVRVKNNHGIWSTYLRKIAHVFKPSLSESYPITAYQYSFNTEPGEENAVEVPLQPVFALDQELSLPVDQLELGSHTVYFRLKDKQANWSNLVSSEFSISGCQFKAPEAVSGVTPVRIGENFQADLNLLLANVDTGPLTFEVVQEPLLGNFSFSQGIVNFTPNPGTLGTDSIFYKVCNECGTCDSAWWYLDIANEPPVISEAEYQVQAPALLSIPLADLISDLNENLDPASISFAEILSSGAKITLAGNLSIEVDYSETNYNGLDQLTVEVCDLAGACTQATFNIEVEGPSELQIYNAVSPNGDGSNDYLKISAIERFPENRFRIINRWGNLVYETEGYNNQDRRFEGKGNQNGSGKLPSGTYFYELYLASGNRIINGFLMLQY